MALPPGDAEFLLPYWTMCGGEEVNPILLMIAEYERNPTIDYWRYEFPLIPFSICFRAYGWVFFAIALVSFLACILCAIGVHLLWRDQWQRKTLYGLFFGGNLIRGVLCALCFAQLRAIKTPMDMKGHSEFFLRYLLPVGAEADLWVAWVDVLLTWFWIQAQRQSPSHRSPWPLIVAAGVSQIMLGACVIYDYLQLDDLKKDAFQSANKGLQIWGATLIFVGFVLTTTAVLHVAAALALLYRFKESYVFRNSSFRLQLFKIGAITATTMLCCILRGMSVLFRYKSGVFQEGYLSFNSANFTAVYFLVLIPVPTVVIAVAYFSLALDGIRERLGLQKMVNESTESLPLQDTSSQRWRYENQPSAGRFTVPDD
jgi:hypothetical protein